MDKVVPKFVEDLVDRIVEVSDPVSVFLYGSMARDDFENDSDYEIGIVYEAGKKWSRQQLKDLNPYENVKLYPFALEELKSEKIDTPFPKAIYLKTITEQSVRLYGKKVEDLVGPVFVSKDDLIEQIGFCLGRAYSAVVSSRNCDWEAVRDGFTKSFLYGLQLLIFVKTKKLVYSYKEIGNSAKKYVPCEFEDLMNHAIDVRKGKTIIEIPYLYKNISFLNKILLSLKKI